MEGQKLLHLFGFSKTSRLNGALLTKHNIVNRTKALESTMGLQNVINFGPQTLKMEPEFSRTFRKLCVLLRC